MSTGFEKPGYNQEIAPDRKLLALLQERWLHSDVLKNQTRKLSEETKQVESVADAIAEALNKNTLTAQEREELKQLLKRYSTLLSDLENELKILSRDSHAALDAVDEILELDKSFTSHGGQA